MQSMNEVEKNSCWRLEGKKLNKFLTEMEQGGDLRSAELSQKTQKGKKSKQNKTTTIHFLAS